MKVLIENKYNFLFHLIYEIITGKIKIKNIINNLKYRIKLLKDNKFYIYLVENDIIIAKYTKNKEYLAYDGYDIHDMSEDNVKNNT